MLTRVVKSAFVVMGLGFALACGGAETTDAEQPEGVTAEAQAPESGDVSAQVGPGCGGFKQRCCEGKYCNTGFECSPSTLTCLY
ncbi:hypothetical protein KH5H1_58070 [Corallococcus caeni]|uniref:Uncharacterized protein n=2 Tax=Corallococcus TaxID=83461 RepID=A0A7Y4JWV6_9BACT|nr:hypothetical protein [Corallococcus exercitus]NOK12691.1 hypothetical protein [Corallococcus exercitus]GMU01687.1 hypothetical protein KH5H1_58070 [Corallococcus sp. KH5-1]GMU06224.1 hypothetical protein ASNO1_24770 [Corallococcus sp. NO1]